MDNVYMETIVLTATQIKNIESKITDFVSSKCYQFPPEVKKLIEKAIANRVPHSALRKMLINEGLDPNVYTLWRIRRTVDEIKTEMDKKKNQVRSTKDN